MKKYKVEFTKLAQKQLYKLDPTTFHLITNWISKNLVDCENPREKGKGLTANHSGEWRYRVGDYRIITKIQDDVLTILILEVGHRSKIYD